MANLAATLHYRASTARPLVSHGLDLKDGKAALVQYIIACQSQPVSTLAPRHVDDSSVRLEHPHQIC